ncbi:transketolase [Candidatus Laterigemmans baculatus]|uniref:transketolase n=1 Tax=Candidatus Laterigemmans baculatus TaxID=2770505 RepID=UPI0013DAA507|nr:transketolase [Candidatus Laterigemmans baculatus]
MSASRSEDLILSPQASPEELDALARQIRVWVLKSTHAAASGHPTSALSAVELMTALCFGGILRYDPHEPEAPNNDRLIFSKGHASPLLYALWAAAGEVSEEELMTYRQFDSRLEGHPTSRFSYAEAATGSLGQGLSIGLGMALAAKKLDSLDYRTFVLLGDSEMAEGSNWEAIQLAAHYGLDNLIGILDVNRLGQRGETMYGHDLEAYRKRVEPFGWRTVMIENGHDHAQILDALRQATAADGRPVMVIAHTEKGHGVSFLADQDGRHGKALGDDELGKALAELGKVERRIRGTLASPSQSEAATSRAANASAGKSPRRSTDDGAPRASIRWGSEYKIGEEVATRAAYGKALARLGELYPQLVALDGEVSNSTHSEELKKKHPERFFEMYIAEQNMVGTAVGMALRGKLPFVSTFAAFFSRAFDQIRMSPHSGANVKFIGSHAGVSIGEDGPSQMGLEDIALFRSVADSVVLYPCDAVSTEHLVAAMADHEGLAYLRTTRGKTPVIYNPEEPFPIGGAKVLRSNDEDQMTIVAAGITVHEALKASDQLLDEGIRARVIDLYSIKPINHPTLEAAARETGRILTVEDHYAAGGLGEAVCHALSDNTVAIRCLAVDRRPRSGTPERLLESSGISAARIVEAARRWLRGSREDASADGSGKSKSRIDFRRDGKDEVEIASEQSFPASDAPGWTGT